MLPSPDDVAATANGATAKRKKTKRAISRRSSSINGARRGGGDNDQASPTAAAFLVPVSRPTERYSDLGGMGDIIQMIRQLVEYPVTRPELYRHLGVDPPRGVLLRGPPGTYVQL